MTEAELSFEERNHLWTLCGFSFLVVSFSFLAWLLYFKRTEFPLTGWGIFIWVGLPCSIIGPTSFFLAYEVFYPRRVRKSPMFHLKRFARRTLSLVAVVLSFSAVVSISDVSFSKTLGSNAIFSGIVAFLLVFFAAVFLWLRRQHSRSQW
jgi:drug/metabolite transporter (DMT)-like permease